MHVDLSVPEPHPLSRLDDEFVWRGKYSPDGSRREVDLLPSRAFLALAESHGRRDTSPNLLVQGDNLHAMHLLSEQLRGQVTVAYLDPPFDVGSAFAMRTQLGHAADADGRRRDSVDLPAYDDRWQDGDGWSRMVWQRLVLVRELLADDGTIYVHCDWRTNHRMRALLDDVFGDARFGNEIAWCYSSPGRSASRFKPCHDSIFRYTRGPAATWTRPQQPLAAATLQVGSLRFGGQEQAWTRTRTTRDMADWWTIPFPTGSSERTGYPTQKPIELLTRIIEASSQPGDLVLDPFGGSGSTAIAALRTGRRFVSIDAGEVATRVAAARLDAALDPEQPGWQLLQVRADGPPPAAGTLDASVRALAEGRVAVAITGHRPDLAALVDGLDDATAGQLLAWAGRAPLDLLERWVVGVRDPDDGSVRVLATRARGRRRRELAFEVDVEVDAPANIGSLVIEALDVRGRRAYT